jgi:hypothetical protein
MNRTTDSPPDQYVNSVSVALRHAELTSISANAVSGRPELKAYTRDH